MYGIYGFQMECDEGMIAPLLAFLSQCSHKEFPTKEQSEAVLPRISTAIVFESSRLGSGGKLLAQDIIGCA